MSSNEFNKRGILVLLRFSRRRTHIERDNRYYRTDRKYTGLLRLKHFDIPEGTAVYAKLEMMNPGGSIKDRLGGMLIEDALRTGKVKPGGVIIEATAGNTGIGLALCARKHQLRAVFCVPEHFSRESDKL